MAGLTLAGALALLAPIAPSASAQAPAPQPPAPRTQTPTADPYAGNAAPGSANFPLAAPAGIDSKAKDTAPPFATNAGPFDPATWKYGPAFNPPPKSRSGIRSS